MKILKVNKESPKKMNAEEIVDRLLILASIIDLSDDLYRIYFDEKVALLFEYPFVQNASTILDQKRRQTYFKLKRLLIGC